MNKLFIISVIALLSFQSHAQNGIQLEILDNTALLYSGEELNYFVEVGNSGEILTIEVLDAAGDLVARDLTEVQGSTEGSISIPKNSPSGTYVISVSSLSSEIKPAQGLFSVLNASTFNKNQVGDCCESQEYIPVLDPPRRNPLAISGKVLHNEVGQANIVVLLQIRGENSSFDYTITDDLGLFEFDSRIVGTNEILITTPDHNNLIIEVNQNIYNSKFTDDPAPFVLSNEIMSRSNIEGAVLRSQYEPYVEIQAKYSQPFSFDRTMILKEYVQMNSTLEVIKEIVPFTKMKLAKKDTAVFLLNLTDNMFHKYPPLILVDGFVEPNFSKVLKLPLEKIETIRSWYSGPSKYIGLGRFARYGVISIETNENMVPDEGLFSKAHGLTPNSRFTRVPMVKLAEPTLQFKVSSGYGVGNLEFTLVGESESLEIKNGDQLLLTKTGEKFLVATVQKVVAQKNEFIRVVLKCTEAQYQYLSNLEDINIVFEILKLQN